MKEKYAKKQTSYKVVYWFLKWWSARSFLERRLLFLTFVAAVLLLVITIMYTLFCDNSKLCTSPTCVRTAMDLLNRIDQNLDPCEDFYRFSCGSFLKNTKLDNRSIRSVHNVMEDEIDSQIRSMLEQPLDFKDPIAFNLARKFYRACMNESAIEGEGLKRVKQIFRQIGGWPTLDGIKWSEKQFDWKYAVRALRKIGISLNLFFSLDLEEDNSNPSKYILSLGSSHCSNPSEIEVSIRNIYLDYMEELSVLFGVERASARNDMEDILNFYLKLGKISEEAEAMNETEIFLSPSELQYKYPSIQWFDFINEILAPATAITYDDVIKVSQPYYLKKLEVLLYETKKRIVANVVCFQIIQSLINFLPNEILDKSHEFIRKVDGYFIKKPRWKTCISTTKERLGPVVAVAYIQNYFDDEMKQQVLEITHNVKDQFKNTLIRLKWMDEQTRKVAMKKLIISVEETVSYESLLESIDENNAYNEVEVNENEFLQSTLNIDYVNTNLRFENLRREVKDNWLRQPEFLTGLDIIYSPRSNSLRFPIGVLRGVYFNKHRPAYLNYGALGSVIAHKLSHIFTEAQMDETSKMQIRNWWTPQTLLNYEEKLQCLENQYNVFVVLEVEKHVNGTSTRDENMAELAGKKVAYNTYVNWLQENGPEELLPGLNYSPNQLFWISSAIHHCSKYSADMLEQYIANHYKSPSQFRVNGVLQNIPQFAYDFGCTPGSAMNPVNKCIVW